jgi:hypothetical protein
VAPKGVDAPERTGVINSHVLRPKTLQILVTLSEIESAIWPELFIP